MTEWVAAADERVAGGSGGDENSPGQSPNAPAASALAAQGLVLAAGFAKAALVATVKVAVPPALTALVVALHDQALLLMSALPEVQEAVSKLCFEYWVAGAPSRERASAQLVRFGRSEGWVTPQRNCTRATPGPLV